MTDELFDPPPATKRKRVNEDDSPSEPRPLKKSKSNVTNNASTPTLPSKTKRPVQKNAEAGPSGLKKPTPGPTPTRSSSRVSRPTMKKAVALTSKKKVVPAEVDLEDSDCDRTPPPSVLQPSKTHTPSKPPPQNEPTSKRKVVHLGAFELSSGSEDDAPRPVKKHVKPVNKLSPASEVIDLCSDEDAPPKTAALPKTVIPSAKAGMPKKAAPQQKVLTPQKAARLQKALPPQKVQPTPRATVQEKSDSPKKTAPPQRPDRPNKAAPQNATPTKKPTPPKKASPLVKTTPLKKVIPPKKVTPIHDEADVVVILSSDDETESSAPSKHGPTITSEDNDAPLQQISLTKRDNGVVDMLIASPDAEIPENTNPSDGGQLVVDSTASSAPASLSERTAKLDSNRLTDPDEVPLDYLQASYRDAMERRVSTASSPPPNHISAFSSSNFSAPPRIITFSDRLTTPTLHTPIYFSRTISSITGSVTPKKKVTMSGSIEPPQNPISFDESLSGLAHASQSVLDEDVQTPLVPQPRLPFSFPAEDLSFDAAQPEIQHRDEIVPEAPPLPLPTFSRDSIPEVSEGSVFTPQGIAEDLAMIVEVSDSAVVSREDLILSNLPLDPRNEDVPMCEENTVPCEPQSEEFGPITEISSVSADPSGFLPPPCESDPVIKSVVLSSNGDANPSQSNDSLSSDENLQPESGGPETDDSAPCHESPSASDEFLSNNENTALPYQPAAEQAVETAPSIPNDLKVSSVRLLKALQSMMASKKAGHPSTPMDIITSSLSEIKLPLLDNLADAPGDDTGESVPPAVVDSTPDSAVNDNPPLKLASCSPESSPLSLEEPHKASPDIVAGNDLTSIPDLSSAFEKRPDPANSLPVPTVEDSSKLNPVPLLVVASPSPDLQNSAGSSLASFDELPSPVASSKSYRHATEPLIWSESQSVGISLLDISTSEISISLLMGGSKYDEDEDDDISLSGFELTYPEELC